MQDEDQIVGPLKLGTDKVGLMGEGFCTAALESLLPGNKDLFRALPLHIPYSDSEIVGL